uniref:Uncharacterized protein n=1 Tax=Acrobeloides nanus TaxID=290746 RepID=A0A914CAA3_9BILA
MSEADVGGNSGLDSGLASPESSQKPEGSINSVKSVDSAIEPTTPSESTLSVTSDTTPRRRVQFSERSKPLIDEAHRLLGLGPSTSVPLNPAYPSTRSSRLLEVNHISSRSPSPVPSGSGVDSVSRYSSFSYTPRFSRVDFDDEVTDSILDKKPAWKQLRDSVKDSYYKPRRTVELQKEGHDFMESVLNRPRSRRSASPFIELDRDNSVTRRPRGYEAAIIDNPSGLSPSLRPYAAPAMSSTQGVESRYERIASDIESRLLSTTSLTTGSWKRTTAKEFRRAPEPAVGSSSEATIHDIDDIEYQSYLPRPYYSRPSREDPDYFDFDLQHSISLYRKPEGRYTPRAPQSHERSLLSDYKTKGEAPLSGHLFTQPDTDYRSTNTSLLSAALRTPSFWEHRFAAIGTQVRDSNPISYASLARYKPKPNRFTEYRDPELDVSDSDGE